MNKQDIQQKVKELHEIMKEYAVEMNGLEKELFQAVSDYQKALEEEKIKQIKTRINKKA